MNDIVYHDFDGAAGPGDLSRLLPGQGGQGQYYPPTQQQQQQNQQQPQQVYYPPADPNVERPPSHNQYYSDQTFYNEVLSSLHGFGGGEINGATDVGVSDAMASFGFNSFLFIFLMIGYEVVSRLAPSVYASRKLHVSDDRKVVDIPKSILPFSWVPTIFGTSWLTVRKCAGLDAYFFLRFIRMCFRITFVSGLWGMVVLWPVFASGDGGATGWYYFSMANVLNGDWRLWFPTGFMVLLTIYVLFAMNEEFQHYLDLRMQYLADGDSDMNPQVQHSLIVEEIPKALRSDIALYSYFDTLFPGRIHSAAVVLNIPDLEKVAAKRKRANRRLEKSMAYLEAKGARSTHVVGRKRFRICGIETFPVRSLGG